MRSSLVGSQSRSSNRRVAPGHGANTHPLLALQRSAGNRAVTAHVKAIPVQRHSSWEHAMIGDVNPKDLGAAVDPASSKIPSANHQHVLQGELARVSWFREHPERQNPQADFPDIRWLQLKTSGYWLSYGEMNALADYLPDATTADTMQPAQLAPVLQRMREGIAKQCLEVLNQARPADSKLGAAPFAYAAHSAVSTVSEAGGEVKALDDASSQLGQNRYKGLLSRNACHFAPMSWQRWAEYHAQARREAEAHHAGLPTGATEMPSNAIGRGTEEHERQAWLQNGYGDHFLQDSFAAGHLVNKTLVMQWFAQYLDRLPWYERPWFGLPSGHVREAMEDRKFSSHGQAGIAGRQLYQQGPDLHTADSDDRASGTRPTDIQSAQERGTKAGREAGSGLVDADGETRDQHYAEYDEFLNSAFMQQSGKAAHDWFNETGLWVRNKHGDQVRVGGDDTLLTQSDAMGAELVSAAAHQSQQAIADLLAGRSTAPSPEEIFANVPSTVMFYAGKSWHETPLENWNDDQLRQLCFAHIFPDVVNSFTNWGLRIAAGDLVKGGVTH